MTDDFVTRRLRACRYFTGLGFSDDRKACEAGVVYREHVGGDDLGWALRAPCIDDPKRKPDMVSCPLRVPYTREEAEAEERKWDERWQETLRKMNNGICHVCNAKVEKEVQVGCCVYAEPCGHRLYQGTAKGADDE